MYKLYISNDLLSTSCLNSLASNILWGNAFMKGNDENHSNLFIFLILLLFVLIPLSACANPKVISADLNYWKEEINTEEIVFSFEKLEGENQRVLRLEPEKEYLIEYELRFDRGLFDVFITDSDGEVLFFRLGTEEIKKNLLLELEGNVNLHMIGGTVKLKATDEVFNIIVKGDGEAAGYLKINWIEVN